MTGTLNENETHKNLFNKLGLSGYAKVRTKKVLFEVKLGLILIVVKMEKNCGFQLETMNIHLINQYF